MTSNSEPSSYGIELTVYPCGNCGHAKADHDSRFPSLPCLASKDAERCPCHGWTPKKASEPHTNGTMTTADYLRSLVGRFPLTMAIHGTVLLAAADELDALRRDMTEAATRIELQSDLLSRQRNAAKRCLTIAQEEAETYQRHANDYPTNGAAAVACRRIADRIEGEVLT